MKTSAGFEIEDVVSCQVRLVETSGVHTVFMERDRDRVAAAINLLEQCNYKENSLKSGIGVALAHLNDL